MLLNIVFKQDCIGKVLPTIYLNLVGLSFLGQLNIGMIIKVLQLKKGEVLGYSKTFLHHRGHNPHHYEYWIHSLDGEGVPSKMPKKYVLELICDYLAAAKTYGNNPREEYNWWIRHRDELKIHSDTKEYITQVFYNYYIGLSLKKSIYGNY